jgi:hypothetical protein
MLVTTRRCGGYVLTQLRRCWGYNVSPQLRRWWWYVCYHKMCVTGVGDMIDACYHKEVGCDAWTLSPFSVWMPLILQLSPRGLACDFICLVEWFMCGWCGCYILMYLDSPLKHSSCSITSQHTFCDGTDDYCCESSFWSATQLLYSCKEKNNSIRPAMQR